MNQQEVLIALRNWVVGRSRIVKGTIALTSEDLGSLIIVDSTSSVTLTLPDLRLTPFDWGRIQIKNVNSGTVTVAAVSGQYIESATSFQLAQYEGCELFEYKGKWYHEIITPTKGLSVAALAGITGDVTIGPSGVSEIGDGKVTAAKLAGITGDVTIGPSGVSEIGDGKVTAAKLGSDVPLIVATGSGVDINSNLNALGLASAVDLANDIKACLVSHVENATRHTTGVQDVDNIPADADDLASLIVLTNALTAAYTDHNDDAVLAAGWAYHSAQAADKPLTSSEDVDILSGAITQLNDIKAKLNDHEDETVGHADQASVAEDQVSEEDAACGAVALLDASVDVGDIVLWEVIDPGSGTVTKVAAVADNGTISFEFSDDPGDDVVIDFIAVRPTS